MGSSSTISVGGEVSKPGYSVIIMYRGAGRPALGAEYHVLCVLAPHLPADAPAAHTNSLDQSSLSAYLDGVRQRFADAAAPGQGTAAPRRDNDRDTNTRPQERWLRLTCPSRLIHIIASRGERSPQQRLCSRVQPQTRIHLPDRRLEARSGARLVNQPLLDLRCPLVQNLSRRQRIAARLTGIGNLEESNQKIRHLPRSLGLLVRPVAFARDPTRLHGHASRRTRSSRTTSVAAVATPKRCRLTNLATR